MGRPVFREDGEFARKEIPAFPVRVDDFLRFFWVAHLEDSIVPVNRLAFLFERLTQIEVPEHPELFLFERRFQLLDDRFDRLIGLDRVIKHVNPSSIVVSLVFYPK